MSLLVEADEQEPAILSVARLVADLEHDESLPSTAVSWLEKGELQPLLSRLAGSQLLTTAGEKDAEAAFTVLAHAADALPEDQALAAVTAIADRVADAAAGAGPLRLRVLFSLFNAVPQPRCRFVVLVRALQFATATGQADALAHLVPRVSSWSSDWHLEPSQLRALRLAVYELLDKSGTSGKQSLAALVEYLALFEGEAGAALASVRDLAARATTAFIAAPDVFQCDLLDMAAVRQLESDSTYGKLHRLLTIFLTGQLGDYLAFQKDNADVLTKHGLDHAACMAKMRLMSLAALGAESSTGQVAYSRVQEVLQVPAEEVESWVVKAIAAGVLEAKLDQVREAVLVNLCLHRVFGPQQWAELRSKLALWRDNVASVATSAPPPALAQSA